MSLEGVHVAYCEETPSGMVIDDATIKSLTSLARQRARTLYQVRERDIELIVTFFIETNELPRIDTTDRDQAEAVFNRLCVITFTNPLAQAEVDPNIKQRLITEQELLDAVFTWVIHGYFDYAKNGLNPPDSVKEASEDYQLKTRIPSQSSLEMRLLRMTRPRHRQETFTTSLNERQALTFIS